MKTKNENTELHYFHIGKGGRFNNAGYLTYVGTIKESEIECRIGIELVERDGIGRFFNCYIDNVGCPVISKKDYLKGLKDGRLVIEFDGYYDTDIFVTENEMTDSEKDLFEEN